MTTWNPTRRGRFADLGDWQAQYRALRMTGEEAAALIRDGDALVFAPLTNWPREMDAALAKRLLAEGGRVEINSHFAPPESRLLSPQCAGHVVYQSNFFGFERAWVDRGNVRFVPTHLGSTPAWLASRHPRATVITCSPPDGEGWMSRSIWGTLLDRRVLEQCELLVVEVHPELPAFCSDGEGHTRLHVSEVDAIIETGGPLLESPAGTGDETDRRIAGHIADLVPNGACVQFGLGGLANAIGENLAYAGKRDLGVQTEVLSPCVMKLMRQGVVNNSRKATCTGRTACAQFVGGRELWDFGHENPAFCQKEISWINDPRNIARNDNVVSVNNAMEVDLTGQVNAESVGSRQYSGTGGQLEWVVGAQWSRGGKSIIALRSSYVGRDGVLRSKLVPALAPGSVVTTPRTCVEYVVTEYGVANLKYKSTLERARALIAIAHPDFREELRRSLPF